MMHDSPPIAPPRKNNAGQRSPRFLRVAARGAPVQQRLHPSEPPTDEIEHIAAELKATINALTADVGMWFVWLLAWLLNGAATILATITVGQSLSALLIRRGWIEAGPRDVDWVIIGVGVHLLISRIEQHGWKAERWTKPPSMRNMQAWLDALPDRLRGLGTVRTLQAVAVGSLDSLSSARAILVLFFDAPGLAAIVGCSMIGTGIAMAAEPMLGVHWRRIKTGWRLRCSLQSRLLSLRSQWSAAS